MILLLAIVAAGSGHDVVLTEQCDTLEVNHFYDNNGKLVFDQVIVWRADRYGQMRVDAWWLLKDPHSHPIRNGQWYQAVFSDDEHVRRIRSRCIVITWTQHDPEIEDRKHRPKKRRPNLLAP